MLCSTDIMEAVDEAKPPEKETKREEDKFSMIHLLQTSNSVKYRNINKDLQNGSYVGKDKYPTNYGVYYEMIVRRPDRYQSIGNGSNGRRRGKSKLCGNQHNQRKNVMFIQQDSNVGNQKGCLPENQIVPVKDV